MLTSSLDDGWLATNILPHMLHHCLLNDYRRLSQAIQPKSKLCYNRRSVGQSALASSPIWSTKLDLGTVRQFRICRCGSSSLMRGWVHRLQLLLARANKSQNHCHFRTSDLPPINLSSNQARGSVVG
jgi:hypothetical protein